MKACRHVKHHGLGSLTIAAEQNAYTSSVEICCPHCGVTFLLETSTRNASIYRAEREAHEEDEERKLHPEDYDG